MDLTELLLAMSGTYHVPLVGSPKQQKYGLHCCLPGHEIRLAARALRLRFAYPAMARPFAGLLREHCFLP